jgi:hypothetical protein
MLNQLVYFLFFPVPFHLSSFTIKDLDHAFDATGGRGCLAGSRRWTTIYKLILSPKVVCLFYFCIWFSLYFLLFFLIIINILYHNFPIAHRDFQRIDSENRRYQFGIQLPDIQGQGPWLRREWIVSSFMSFDATIFNCANQSRLNLFSK